MAHGVDGRELEDVLERPAGHEEQIPVDGRQREQARAGVEGEPVAGVPAELAPDHRSLFEHGHVVPEPGEARGGGQPAEPGPDDDDAAHVRTVPPTLKERAPSASSTATTSTSSPRT